ncbi:MAG: hypothetical protein V1753_07295 [Pseudomonadota bacterium]
MNKLFQAIMAGVLVCTSSLAFAADFGVKGTYWFSKLSGDVKVDSAGITGTSINLADDLGMDDESYPAIEAFVGLGSHHISASAIQIDYSGSKSLTKEINFNGETFNVNEQVDSSLKYTMLDIEYQYDIVDLENILAGGSIGAIGKVKYIDGDVEIKSNIVNQCQSFTAPIPMIGIGLHLGILADLLEASVKGTGIGYSGSTLYEIMADISWTPFPLIDIHAGYAITDLDADVEDVELSLTMAGPYAGVSIGF